MPRLLALDNHDSFTFTLVDYLRQAGAEVHVVRDDAGLTVADALDIGLDGIMVSPGPGTPEKAGISVALTRAAVEARRPFLGVCLGHQALAVACGSTVERVPPMHGKIGRVRHDNSGLFEGLASPLDMTRYHSLAVTRVQPPLVANAWNAEGLVMGVRHEIAPAHGVQFHPESVASSEGMALIRRFVSMCTTESA